ncbi:hypothetical protein M426DRAFT_21769 [Hypoxylon sp. CI-4A]|nr:hypothetical protein M426DRAFT_21769 [Hypoxylon sp. CI-4A]
MSLPSKTYLDLVKDCDNFPYIDIMQTSYILELPDFVFYQLLLPNDSRPYGFIHPSVVARMPWTSDFEVSSPVTRPRTVRLLDRSNGENTSGACNAAFLDVVQKATDMGSFSSLHRRRRIEDCRVLGVKYPPIQMRRAAAPLFGIAIQGAHMTMYTHTAEGDIKIWVPRRSAYLRTYPGKLDSTVAGSVRADETPFECIVREADEEASIPEYLVRQHLRPCGAITYMSTDDRGSGREAGLLASGIIYLYDMKVDHTIVPTPQDDEVQEFYLWDVNQVKEALLRGEFKTSCASVMIDFFIRHGIIMGDNEPDYLEIILRLHRALPMPMTTNG